MNKIFTCKNKIEFTFTALQSVYTNLQIKICLVFFLSFDFICCTSITEIWKIHFLNIDPYFLIHTTFPMP